MEISVPEILLNGIIINPITIVIVSKAYFLPEANGCELDSIGYNGLEVFFAVIDKFFSIAIAFKFGIDIDRADGNNIIINFASGFANSFFANGDIYPIIFGVRNLLGGKFNNYSIFHFSTI